MTPSADRPPVLILCGGRGMRLQERTGSIPKPLVEIGGRPILWHVMSSYAAQGFEQFVLCLGYRGELIESYVREHPIADTTVRCLPTGLETPTGGRIALAREHVANNPFCVTYADGLADVDHDALLGFHREHGALATLTAVRPALPFGVCRLDGSGRVLGFEEKPRSEHWINGGFFCLEPGALDYLTPTSVLEREPLERLAADGQLHAYRHSGFWECMDTYKDSVELNDLWARGEAPWAQAGPSPVRPG